MWGSGNEGEGARDLLTEIGTVEGGRGQGDARIELVGEDENEEVKAGGGVARRADQRGVDCDEALASGGLSASQLVGDCR